MLRTGSSAGRATARRAATTSTPRQTQHRLLQRQAGVRDEGEVTFFLNGKKERINKSVGRTSLLTWLREQKGLTGTKSVCNEGGCGACTVMVSRWDDSKINYEGKGASTTTGSVKTTSVAGCLTPLPFLDGTSVWTVEGLRNVQKHDPSVEPDLHPIQKAIVQSHGTQCGYCTPGIVMAYTSQLTQKNGQSTCADFEHSLDGNLCRCTGYRPILDAGKLLACDEYPNLSNEQKVLRAQIRSELEQLKADGNGEMFPFPEELRGAKTESLSFRDRDGSLWLRPTNLTELLELKSLDPNSTMVAGSHSHPYEGASQPKLSQIVSGYTDIGYKPARGKGAPATQSSSRTFVSTSGISELRDVTWTDNGVWLGAGLSINTLARLAEEGPGDRVLTPEQKRALKAIHHQTRFFANNQVRDMGTIGGSLANCSQVSDLVPAMIAMEAKIDLVRLDNSGGSSKLEHRVLPASKFVLGDKSTDLKADEVMTRVFIPYTKANEYVLSFKHGHKRRVDSQAVLSSSMRLVLDQQQKNVERAVLVWGGLGVAGLRSTQLEQWLQGKPWTKKTFDESVEVLRKEIPSMLKNSRQVKESTREFQGTLILGNWLKMWSYVDSQMPGGQHTSPLTAEDVRLTITDTSVFEHEVVHKGSQNFEYQTSGNDGEKTKFEVGGVYDAAIHVNASEQTTGEARYPADFGIPPSGFHGAIVPARYANAGFSLNASDALHDIRQELRNEHIHFFSAVDVPGNNTIPGFRPGDIEHVFAQDRTLYNGQPIGIAVAKDYDTARNAARIMGERVEYNDIRPAVGNIEDAYKAGESSFFSTPPIYSTLEHYLDFEATRSPDRLLRRGNPEEKIEAARKSKNSGVVSGTVDLQNGQQHFYLETQNCVVLPSQGSTGKNPSFRIHASSQSPSNVTTAVANALGLPANSVVCKTERIGGGFGGKQTRGGLIAAAAAVPAFHLDAPIKLQLNRSEDMAYCPGRVPFVAKYEVSWEKAADGSVSLTGVKIHLDADGGYSQDYAVDVLETAMFVVDGGYALPHDVQITGRCAITNKGSYTATRGFGKPQAAAIIECIMDDVAAQSGADPIDLRYKALYKPGEISLTNTVIGDDVLRMCWNGVVEPPATESKEASGLGLPPQNSSYPVIRKHCDDFNAKSKWIKRGVAVVPSKGNMGFIDCPDVNRGIALLHCHKDGSVSITHSGVEMGQGLATRLSQVAATALGIDSKLIRIVETDTFAVPNTPPTTMVSTDLAGSAIQAATNRLLKNMEPVREKLKARGNANPSWQELCYASYMDGVEMSTVGSKQYPNLVYDWKKQTGDVSYFFVWGSAMSIVEVDLISGQWRTLRTDLVQDCGQRSLNPALDVGQCEGGFMFGLGYYMQEEMEYDVDRESFGLFSNNVAKYKIPTHDDIPLEWNVKLLKYDPEEPHDGVYGTKGIGEANIGLAMSVYLGVKDAVRAARRDRGLDPRFEITFPATADKIRAAIPDRYSFTFKDKSA